MRSSEIWLDFRPFDNSQISNSESELDLNLPRMQPKSQIQLWPPSETSIPSRIFWGLRQQYFSVYIYTLWLYSFNACHYSHQYTLYYHIYIKQSFIFFLQLLSTIHVPNLIVATAVLFRMPIWVWELTIKGKRECHLRRSDRKSTALWVLKWLGGCLPNSQQSERLRFQSEIRWFAKQPSPQIVVGFAKSENLGSDISTHFLRSDHTKLSNRP
jgi:hypothetical protein